MNTELLKSKKFRTAVLAAISSLLSFLVAKFGLNLNVDEIITLITTIVAPLLIYIGAEGFSEAGAKKSIEENKARTEINDKVLQSIVEKIGDSNK